MNSVFYNCILLCSSFVILCNISKAGNCESFVSCKWLNLLKQDISTSIECELIYDQKFLIILPEFRTMDNYKYNLSENDIVDLTRRYRPTSTMAVHKKYIVIMYKKKIQCLQCTIGYIVQQLMNHYKYCEEQLKSGHQFGDVDILGRHVKLVTHMFSVMYKSKVLPHSFLLVFYLKLLVLNDWQKNKQLITKDVFNDGQFATELENFLNTCKKNMYLSEPGDSSLTMSGADILAITENVIKPLFGNRQLTITYAYGDMFTVDHFFFINTQPENVLFESIFTGTIDWTGTKLILQEAKKKCNTHLEQCSWVNNPFICREFHDLIMQILKVRLLANVWEHMQVYQMLYESIHKNSNEKYVMVNKLKDRSARYYFNYIEYVDYLGIKDKIFWDVVQLLHTEDLINLSKLKSLTSQTLNKLITGLKNVDGFVSNIHENLKYHSILTTNIDHTSMNSIETNTQTLKNDLINVKTVLKPLDIFIINIYRKGYAPFTSTFYYNEEIK